MTAVSIKAACVIADVSRRTMYNWMNRGLVRWVETASGRRLIVVASLFRGDPATVDAVVAARMKEGSR